ncbi:MAG: DinB family protein [Actinomycetota bacterium]|nr:DinB family protein [Actinomycetota bacterium]
MDAPSSPDPVFEPRAYQDHILSFLGQDDPAEVQAAALDSWHALLTEAGELGWSRPEPSEWSVIECLGHALDAEIVSSARYRWILAHDEPALIGYDQDLWVDRIHAGRNDDPAELLDLFDPLRRANLALWARSSEEDRARVGIHTERGRESYELVFRLLAGHDRFHLAQARRALEAVSGG